MNKISVIGVPLDLGASKRGASLAPDAVRYAGLLEELISNGHTVEDLGNIEVRKFSGITEEGVNLKNFNIVKEANDLLADRVSEVVKEGSFPLVIGGDHSIAMGSIKGNVRAGRKVGVIWMDAHGDINTADTSPSGNIHGMPIASLLGIGCDKLNSIAGEERIDLKNLVLVGQRDLDLGERKAIKDLGVTCYTMADIDKLGIEKVMELAIEQATDGVDGIHLSFDMDCITPEICPGTGTKVPGGLTYRETSLALELISDSKKLISAEIVEVNPILDDENKTAELAVDLANAMLGFVLL